MLRQSAGCCIATGPPCRAPAAAAGSGRWSAQPTSWACSAFRTGALGRTRGRWHSAGRSPRHLHPSSSKYKRLFGSVRESSTVSRTSVARSGTRRIEQPSPEKRGARRTRAGALRAGARAHRSRTRVLRPAQAACHERGTSRAVHVEQDPYRARVGFPMIGETYIGLDLARTNDGTNCVPRLVSTGIAAKFPFDHE
jgi:hypothetical protein